MAIDGRQLLPPQLKEEHRDALIICVEDDLDKARDVQNAIEEMHFDINRNDIRGKAIIFSEAVSYVSCMVDRLDEALKFNTLTFVIYSKDLVADCVNMRTSNAVLWQTIEERSKLYNFVPVFWKTEKSQLPVYVRALNGLNLNKPNWKLRLKTMIEIYLPKRLERHQIQETEQLKYLRERYPDFVREKASTKSIGFENHILLPSAVYGDGDTRFPCNESSEVNVDVHADDVINHDDPHDLRFPFSVWNLLLSRIGERMTVSLSAFGVGIISVLAIFVIRRNLTGIR